MVDCFVFVFEVCGTSLCEKPNQVRGTLIVIVGGIGELPEDALFGKVPKFPSSKNVKSPGKGGGYRDLVGYNQGRHLKEGFCSADAVGFQEPCESAFVEDFGNLRNFPPSAFLDLINSLDGVDDVEFLFATQCQCDPRTSVMLRINGVTHVPNDDRYLCRRFRRLHEPHPATDSDRMLRYQRDSLCGLFECSSRTRNKRSKAGSGSKKSAKATTAPPPTGRCP